MLQAIIRTEGNFYVKSWGNGLAYSLHNKERKLSVLFQTEEDSAAFREDLNCEVYTLAFLWEAYSQFAIHDGEPE